MKKFIVTTTIYSPSAALLKFASMLDWHLIVIGDLKTPHNEYYKLGDRITYLSPETQEAWYPKLSNAIGWNCIMRRNIGFLYAYQHGADIVASIDDDNIPYDNWGEDIRVGKEINVDIYNYDIGVLDPLQFTNQKHLWHRGYPIDYIKRAKQTYYTPNQKRKILFQVDLWDGDPDVDAICRVMYNPTNLNMKILSPFTSDNYIPFNSQNTFIAREALPYYMVLPHVGRVDDIWGGYIAQYLLNTRPLFMPSTVYQKRNDQSIQKNIEDEVYGYVNTSKFLEDITNYGKYLPSKTLTALAEYRLAYDKIKS
jgi:hypothetical protein